MAEDSKKFGLVQVIAVLFVIGLFAADYGFDVMAKQPPWWAYVVPGLLALGLEVRALRRLVVQAVRVAAKLPPEDDQK
ncbi:hypothetical protein [Celeribacter sp. SCSIO 80788]|uniref:hypothetical protein n=1 Tax=Celeribacter sp. SCSIO 80788 TaxID=3117013 RepID=UPI003DA688AA